MGSYTPADKDKKQTISDTLAEAEADHLLDCPNADYLIRATAVVLDAILFWIAWTVIHHVCIAIGNSLGSAINDAQNPLTDPRAWMRHISWGFKTLLVYLYFVYSVVRFGGSPAKLLLGLRVCDESTGKNLSLSQAFLRELVGKGISLLSAGIGLLITIARKDHRLFHDLLSRSVVKRVQGA